MGALYKMIAAQLVGGHEPEVLRNYLFDGRPLTNDNPYFAGYVKLADLPAVFGMLDAVSDEWGYLLLWGTLAESLLLGLVLLLIPSSSAGAASSPASGASSGSSSISSASAWAISSSRSG